MTGPVVKVLVIVGAILGFALMLYFIAGLPSPREADRLTTFDGSLSMIPPTGRGWTSGVKYGPSNDNLISQIEIIHSDMIGIPDSLRASRFRNAVEQADLEKTGFVPGTFQNEPAWIFSKQVKRSYIWRMIFQRHGQWYDITLALQRQEDVPSSGWWPFINSFQAKPGKIPSSVPSTAPSLLLPTTQFTL